ncbi:glucose-6-phosphate dehydrogenase assembly protein OpcA [Paraconexibacter antarcticus]|uniref:Glucose-6-phosphate dehydrogenase assembly protein OpcA n=1 Tax=Paraconexibacter antarcticus TaxID=2949664 RepID=A0ABY5DXL7_9ACTN|nr:glucose-6-phosphate dehydrogenase assembly protein OpcA [Paraconexibacter antarcticus]UTI66431.1 glucose-6-phosphate dehydrogenase assembly protein OpcA [Paraconexibacter antarcticus]
MAAPPAAMMDGVWRERDTSPAAIEAAIRRLLGEAHAANSAYVPARVMNLVCIVDKQWSGEIANRLRRVGRLHPSRTVVVEVEPRRTTLDAVATVAGPAETKPGDFAVLRETVIVTCGPQHLAHVDTIVDPLVVTDLSTMVWAPHGHDEAVDALRHLSQIVLLDSVADPDVDEALQRASDLSDELYVVDLAWLRSTPWRERIAATFDPAPVRGDLKLLSGLQIRHHPDSAAAALLVVGWLGSRLGWELSPLVTRAGNGATRSGTAHGKRQDVKVKLVADPSMSVPGLAGVTLESASGRTLRFDRGEGGLRAHYRRTVRGGADVEREWTVLGASRGESGILGEGIRQALLRDPTYGPALEAALVLAG